MNKNGLLLKVVVFTALFTLNALAGTPRKNFSVWGGADFNKVGSSFYFETYFPILQATEIKLSVGIYNTYSSNTYTVNTYKNVHIADYNKIHLISYNVTGTDYTVIPFALGVNYTFDFETFAPFFSVDVNYNLIDPNTIQTNETVQGVLDVNESVPEEYRTANVLPGYSFGINLAAGGKFEIYSNLTLGIRYQFNIRKEIVNSHQLLVGIYF